MNSMDSRTITMMSNVLKENGINLRYHQIRRMNEANNLNVADKVVGDMLKFITDKYNALDFREIEASAGDYNRFKYRPMIDENIDTLEAIYTAATTQGADKYLKLLNEIKTIENWLVTRRTEISYLYKKRQGAVQMVYTSTVASIVYAVAALVSNTIRFVTVDKDSDLNALFDELPNAFKNVHIRNVAAISNAIPEFNKFIDNMMDRTRKGLSEATFMPAGGALKTAFNAATKSTIGKVLVYGGAAVAIGWALWKSSIVIFNLIRNIVYNIYYSRIKFADALAVNQTLLSANIDKLNAEGNVSADVIRKQSAALDKITMLVNKFSTNSDTGEIAANREIERQNRTISNDQVDFDSKDDYGNDILL